MLVISRRVDEGVVLTVGDDRIDLRVVAIRGDMVRLGFTAPLEVTIHRGEVQQQIDAGSQKENQV